MQVKCKHISANCNPMPNVVDFLDKDTLVFGFSNNLALYSLSQNRILLTIFDHQQQHRRTNCLVTFPQQQLIISGYDTGYLNGYACRGHQWQKVFSHKQGSGLLSLHLLTDKLGTHLLTNNNNSEISHYLLEKQELKLLEVVKFPLNRLIETLCCWSKGKTLMMFLGGVDQKVHYYQKNLAEPKQNFLYRCSLSGHENAITKLVITEQSQEKDLLLASSSKDGYVRLWRITNDKEVLKFHKNVYPVLQHHNIFLESVLSSHECSVTNLAWVRYGGSLQLMSSSLDCTICIWAHQEQSWTVRNRLGQLLGNKNAYFDIKADPEYQHLVALNYTGALLIWKWAEGKWVLRQSCNGHSREVKGLEWNNTGDFLVSVSMDQTTRVLAQNTTTQIYHQVARAQIHGYDINAVTVLKVKEQTLDLIVCGADEKVIRVLEPPACFANYLNSFTHANLHLFFPSLAEEAKFIVSKPEDPVLLYESYSEGGAQVLGLMTKMQRVEREKITNYYQQDEGGPVTEEVEENKEEFNARSQLDYSMPPHEDYLVKHTLWPEMAKLYGHPHQIATLCRSNSSKHLVSSCKALNKESASIIVWRVEDWKIVKVIPLHHYTVYALEFSPSDIYLASASKDRKLAVFDLNFNLLFHYEAHLRAITCLSFHLDDDLIITGSRDKTIKLHSVTQKKTITELNIKQPVSAIAFCREEQLKNYFAIGCFNGDIIIGVLREGELSVVTKIEQPFNHSGEINSLKWWKAKLASCSDDFSVRIFELSL